MKKAKQPKNTKTELSSFDYQRERALRRSPIILVDQEMGYVISTLMAQLHVLGFVTHTAAFPYIKKIKKNDESTLGYMLEPFIYFHAIGLPLEYKKGESKIVAKELEKHGHTHFHPYFNWIQSDDLRDEIDGLLESKEHTGQYKEWAVVAKKAFKKLDSIVTAFQEKYPKSIIQFYEYDNSFAISCIASKQKEDRFKMKKEDKQKIVKKYEKAFIEFTNFINEYMGSNAKI